MKSFLTSVLIAVLTSEQVQTMLKGLVRAAVDDAVGAEIRALHHEITVLGSDVTGWVDGLDGTVGNLQQQLTGIPGQIVGGVIAEIRKLIPFGLGGQQ